MVVALVAELPWEPTPVALIVPDELPLLVPAVPALPPWPGAGVTVPEIPVGSWVNVGAGGVVLAGGLAPAGGVAGQPAFCPIAKVAKSSTIVKSSNDFLIRILLILCTNQ